MLAEEHETILDDNTVKTNVYDWWDDDCDYKQIVKRGFKNKIKTESGFSDWQKYLEDKEKI